MHLDRPPVLPASVPFALMICDLQANRRGIVAATRIPLHVPKTLETHPSPERDVVCIFLGLVSQLS